MTTSIVKKLDLIEEPGKELEPLEKKEVPEELMDITDSEEDYETVRQTFKDLIQTSTTAIETLETIAQETQHPRAYEVLGQLIRTANESTRSLYEIHKKRIEILEKRYRDNAEGHSINVDKAVFVGTPSELFNQIKRMNSDQLKVLRDEH